MSYDPTVVNPLMVYVNPQSEGLSHAGEFDVCRISPDTISSYSGIQEKIKVKHGAGIPADKTLFLDVGDQSYLTWDRREALRISVKIAEGLGSAVLYSLAQTAAYETPEYIHRGYLGYYEGWDMLVRVEEGLSPQAEMFAQKLAALATASRVTEGKTFLSLPGMSKETQVAGYEFNPGQGESRITISDVPACEMFMAALALDQMKLGNRIIRVLPYYMEDREVSAQRSNELVGGKATLDLRVYSVFIGESGDVKGLRTWFGKQPEKDVLDVIRPLRVNSVASAAVSDINNYYANRFASRYKQLAPEVRRSAPSPNSLCYDNQTGLASWLDVLAESPYLSFPLRAIRKSDTVTGNKLMQDVVELWPQNDRLFASRELPEGLRIHFAHSEGVNTNNVVTVSNIPIARRSTASGQDTWILSTCVFGAVGAESVSVLRKIVIEFYSSPTVALRKLQAYMETNKPFYQIIFGERTTSK